MISSFLWNLYGMVLASAPGLLLGFALAGVLHLILKRDLFQRYINTTGPQAVLVATLFGMPLPLCSCSVIPAAITLRKHGASRGATAAFLISTPEIGIDSFILSWSLLGPELAWFRVAAAFATALIVGLAVDILSGNSAPRLSVLNENSSCCEPTPEGANKLFEAVRYGFVTLLDDLSLLLTIGFIAAAAIAAIVPHDFVPGLGLSEIEQMIIMLAVSLPMYVCATASTPLAAALIAKGVQPAAVFVFLLAGPASNITTFLAIRKELGYRTLLTYVVGVIFLTLAFGLIFQGTNIQIPAVITHEHQHHSPWHTALGVLFILLLVQSLYRRVRRQPSN